MSRLKCLDRKNSIYHVYNRGVNKQIIYYDNDDRWFFMNLCKKAIKKFQFHIFAFCLMSNHYHLLIFTSDSNLSKIMKFIGETYSKYFIKKYQSIKKSGHTFMGPYGRKLVQSDYYASKLISYIHLNPYKDGFVRHPKDYFWSSYNSYIAGQDFYGLINLKPLHKYFVSFEKSSFEIVNWHPQQDTVCNNLIGTIEFARNLYGDEYVDKFIQSGTLFPKITNSESIIKCVKNMNLEQSLHKKVLVFCLLEWSELKAKDLEELLGSSSSTIRKIKTRVKQELSINKNLSKLIDKTKEGVLN